MRILVCWVGLFRTFENVFESFFDEIVRPNLAYSVLLVKNQTKDSSEFQPIRELTHFDISLQIPQTLRRFAGQRGDRGLEVWIEFQRNATAREKTVVRRRAPKILNENFVHKVRAINEEFREHYGRKTPIRLIQYPELEDNPEQREGISYYDRVLYDDSYAPEDVDVDQKRFWRQGNSWLRCHDNAIENIKNDHKRRMDSGEETNSYSSFVSNYYNWVVKMRSDAFFWPREVMKRYRDAENSIQLSGLLFRSSHEEVDGLMERIKPGNTLEKIKSLEVSSFENNLLFGPSLPFNLLPPSRSFFLDAHGRSHIGAGVANDAFLVLNWRDNSAQILLRSMRDLFYKEGLVLSRMLKKVEKNVKRNLENASVNAPINFPEDPFACRYWHMPMNSIFTLQRYLLCHWRGFPAKNPREWHVFGEEDRGKIIELHHSGSHQSTIATEFSAHRMGTESSAHVLIHARLPSQRPHLFYDETSPLVPASGELVNVGIKDDENRFYFPVHNPEDCKRLAAANGAVGVSIVRREYAEKQEEQAQLVAEKQGQERLGQGKQEQLGQFGNAGELVKSCDEEFRCYVISQWTQRPIFYREIVAVYEESKDKLEVGYAKSKRTLIDGKNAVNFTEVGQTPNSSFYTTYFRYGHIPFGERSVHSGKKGKNATVANSGSISEPGHTPAGPKTVRLETKKHTHYDIDVTPKDAEDLRQIENKLEDAFRHMRKKVRVQQETQYRIEGFRLAAKEQAKAYFSLSYQYSAIGFQNNPAFPGNAYLDIGVTNVRGNTLQLKQHSLYIGNTLRLNTFQGKIPYQETISYVQPCIDILTNELERMDLRWAYFKWMWERSKAFKPGRNAIATTGKNDFEKTAVIFKFDSDFTWDDFKIFVTRFVHRRKELGLYAIEVRTPGETNDPTRKAGEGFTVHIITGNRGSKAVSLPDSKNRLLNLHGNYSDLDDVMRDQKLNYVIQIETELRERATESDQVSNPFSERDSARARSYPSLFCFSTNSNQFERLDTLAKYFDMRGYDP